MMKTIEDILASATNVFYGIVGSDEKDNIPPLIKKICEDRQLFKKTKIVYDLYKEEGDLKSIGKLRTEVLDLLFEFCPKIDGRTPLIKSIVDHEFLQDISYDEDFETFDSFLIIYMKGYSECKWDMGLSSSENAKYELFKHLAQRILKIKGANEIISHANSEYKKSKSEALYNNDYLECILKFIANEMTEYKDGILSNSEPGLRRMILEEEMGCTL